MKKLLFFIVVSVFIVCMGFSQSVTITSPNGGENWVLGSSHQITWTSSGVTGNIKLILFQSGTKLGNIVLDLPVTQSSYTWSVGSHSNGVATPGTGFSVKIRAANGGYSDFSNANFTISPNVPSGTLVVNKPNGGEQWVKNSTKNISWTASGISGTIKLMLFKDGVKLGNIAVNLPMSPSTYSWKVGVHSNGVASVGTGYMIKIRSGNYNDFSDGPFEIIKSPNDGVDRVSGIPDWLKEKLRNMREIHWWKDPRAPRGPIGPGPCLVCTARFDLEKYINILREGGIRGKFTVEVVRAGKIFGKAVFENNKPKVLRGNKIRKMSGGTMRVVKLQKYSVAQGKALRVGRGFKVVIKNAQGRVVAEQPVNVRERGARR